MSAKILIADDTVEIAEILSDHLASKGHRVSVAGDAFELVARAASERPHLMLVDIHMPGTDGSSAYQMLQLEERTKGVPVIFISAYDMKKLEAALPSGPAVRLLEKPIDYDKLDGYVAELLPLGGWKG